MNHFYYILYQLIDLINSYMFALNFQSQQMDHYLKLIVIVVGKEKWMVDRNTVSKQV